MFGDSIPKRHQKEIHKILYIIVWLSLSTIPYELHIKEVIFDSQPYSQKCNSLYMFQLQNSHKSYDQIHTHLLLSMLMGWSLLNSFKQGTHSFHLLFIVIKFTKEGSRRKIGHWTHTGSKPQRIRISQEQAHNFTNKEVLMVFRI